MALAREGLGSLTSMHSKRLLTFACTSEPAKVAAARTSPVAPLGGIWQHKQVQASEQQQDQRKQRQQPDPQGLYPLHHGNEVGDDGQCEGNGQPAVDLSDPGIPAQWDLP